MKSETLLRVLNWFEEYQGDGDREKLFKLYSEELVKEEIEETAKAEKEKDIVEVLDGLGDVLWVSWGALYFNNSFDYGNIVLEIIDYFHIKLSYSGNLFTILDELINVIADSNYTKSKEKRGKGKKAGKIIKGENFVAPTEGIKKIVEKYNIKFKEDEVKEDEVKEETQNK